MFFILCKTLMKEQPMDAVTDKPSKTHTPKSQRKSFISTRWQTFVKHWQALMNGTMAMK